MRAYIKLWGREYLIESLSWYKLSGDISHLGFEDENGVYQVVHSKHFEDLPDAEKNRDADLLYADLEKIVFWVKK